MPPKAQAKPGDKKAGKADQFIDDDYLDLPSLPPINSYIFSTLPAFRYKRNLSNLYASMLKHYQFPPEDPISQKIKVIQREDIINYAKLKQYITEEDSLDLVNKLTPDKLIEVFAKTTYDLLMSFEALLRRAKKDQPPVANESADVVELTVWLKDFPQTTQDFKAFYQHQKENLGQQIHQIMVIEELFIPESEDEDALMLKSSDPTMDRYYEEEQKKKIEEKMKVEFLSEERVAVFLTAYEMNQMFQCAPNESQFKLCSVNKIKFKGPFSIIDLSDSLEDNPPLLSENLDPSFLDFALHFKEEIDQHATDLQEYKKLKKEYQLFSENATLDSGPKPLMPYPEEALKKMREEEAIRREKQQKEEEEKKAQEALLLKKAGAGKGQPAAAAKSREKVDSNLTNKGKDPQLLSPPQTEETQEKIKPILRSRDEEEKEWNFHHLEKVMSELAQENGTVGNILAAMVYQIANQKSKTEKFQPEPLTDQDKQFLKNDQQEQELNDYFDDIFNKLTIEHNIIETKFEHKFKDQIMQKNGQQQFQSPYQSLFNQNDRVSMIAKSYKFLSGEPISLCENSTLQNFQMPGINQRFGMPPQPSMPQPQRESDLSSKLMFSALPQSQARRALLLHTCEQMFKRKEVHPERDFFFLNRNYVEKFDSTALRQVLAQALRYDPDLVYQYDKNEDALLLGVYHKNPPGRMLRRQTTYPLKSFPDYEIWKRFVKHDESVLDFGSLYDIDPSKVGVLRTNSKFCFPCDNSMMRIDKHVIGNRRMGTSLVIKDNLAFGVKETKDKFKSKRGLKDDEILSREACVLQDRKCLFWLEFENGVKMLVEMSEKQNTHLEEMPLQEPLPPHIEEEIKQMNESKMTGGDITEKEPSVQVESVPVGQDKPGTLNNKDSQKSIKGKESQMKQNAAAQQTKQQPKKKDLQKTDSAKSLESTISQPSGPTPQELALIQKKRDEEHRLMSATSKVQFFQDKYDPTNGTKITLTFQEGLIVQIMPNGDVSQQIIENPQTKKKYGGTIHQDPLPAYLQEKSRLVTMSGQVIRYFLDGNMQIFYPDGTVTTTDKRKGIWFTVNAKGIKRVRKLQDNHVYDEPRKLKITEKVDPETSSLIYVRDDGVLTVKYADETKIVMFSDGTQIMTKKNEEIGSGTITIITKDGYAPVRVVQDPVKARAKTIIGLGGADAMIGIENIMARSNNGKVIEVLLPDNSIIQSYQERQELEGYNHFMTNMVHLIKRDDYSVIKVRQDGEIVIISANQRAYLNQIGKQKQFGINDYDHFFELFGVANERRSGVYTVNVDQGRLITSDEEGNVFIVYANGDSVEKLSVSFDLDQMVEGVEKKEPSSPRIKDGEFIEEECKFLPPPKTIAHPRLFLIKNDTGYEFFNSEQLEYLFRCVNKEKGLIMSQKNIKVDNEEAKSYMFLRKLQPFKPHNSFSELTKTPKIPQSVGIINQTVSISVDPHREDFAWRNIVEFKPMDSPQQVEDFKEMIKRHQNMRKKQQDEHERLKVVEIKTEEHKEQECKIWLRIAKEKEIDITQLVGEEFKPLKDVINEEKKQKFLDDLDKFEF